MSVTSLILLISLIQKDERQVISNFCLFLQLQEDPFYVFNVGGIVEKHKEWKMKLPRVQPFYGKKNSAETDNFT